MDAPEAKGQGGGRPGGRAWRQLATRLERGDTYVAVFILLIATYFLVSLLPENTWSRLVQELAVGATLLITLRTSHARLRLQRLARAGVVAGLVLTLVGSLVGGALALVHVVFMLLLLVTPFVILNRILRHQSVSIETIAGAIDVYVLFGLIFSMLYRSIAAIGGTPFFVQTNHASANQFLYFSFVSLTTVGYGDLTANTNFGRSVVVLEPLLGQIFLVTTVARLVSLFRGPRARTGTDG
ncbi:MAG TPA: ion channel [Acidimicrobiales bacterium]|nr:ion channel [Acidimicrobiales bacterium]